MATLFSYKIDRIIVWFSCGIASAIAAQKTLNKYGHEKVEIVYCDTSMDEHPDNVRFMADVQRWLNHPIKILKSKEYTGVFDVLEKAGWLRKNGSAPCTIELKKRLRWNYERLSDLQIMGYTGDEKNRFDRFVKENPEVNTEWILEGLTKRQCQEIIEKAGIQLPEMYKLGYPNNNCMGCVKAESIAYWQHIRKDFPLRFKRMALLERKYGFALNRSGRKDGRKPLFLDELPEGLMKIGKGLEIECGVMCQK